MGNITALDRAESCEVDDSSEMEQINVEHSLAKKCKLESLEVTQTEKSKSTSGSISSAMPIVGEFHLYNYQGTLRDVKLEGMVAKYTSRFDENLSETRRPVEIKIVSVPFILYLGVSWHCVILNTQFVTTVSAILA